MSPATVSTDPNDEQTVACTQEEYDALTEEIKAYDIAASCASNEEDASMMNLMADLGRAIQRLQYVPKKAN